MIATPGVAAWKDINVNAITPDLKLSGTDGTELTRQFVRWRYPKTEIIILIMHANWELLRKPF